MDTKVDVVLRKTYRGQLTKFCNKANELINSNAGNDDLSVLCEQIKALRLNVRELNEKIMPTLTEENIESECVKIAEYDSSAVEAVAKLEVCIRRNCEGRILNEENTASRELLDRAGDNRPNVGNIFQNVQQKTVRLPKLDLVKFDGNIESWPAFWEQFSQAIHENPDLDDNCRFSYLKNQLIGKAAISVSGLTTSSNSYNDAIELLRAEYGQSDKIVDCYVKKLFAIPPMKYDRDASGLRKLYNTVSSITRSLETLGVSANQYSLMVKSKILQVLPYNLRIQFNKYKLNNYQSETANNTSGSGSSENADTDNKRQITDLLEFIKIEVDSVEQAQSVSHTERSKQFENKSSENRFLTTQRRGSPHNNFTAQGLLTLANNSCLFCKNNNHQTKDCRNESIPLCEKKILLKNNSRCFRCTLPNHRSKFCKTRNIECVKCKGRHVTALCDPSYKPNTSTSKSESNKTNESKGGITVATLASSRVDYVYLQTACVYIKSKAESNDLFVRAIIDGGSQLTFIKECISREMNLTVVGTHKISVCSFGSSQRGVARLCNKVEVLLRSQFSDKLIKIFAIEVPEICFDAVKPPSENDPSIRDFAINNYLADVKVETLSVPGISILIGADNYWTIVKNEIQPLTNTLKAVNTEFGWTIHGTGTINECHDLTLNLNVASIFNVQVTNDDFDPNVPNLKLFWDLETIGIKAEMKYLDDFTQSFIENNVIFKDNRYEVTLPWQYDKILDSNYSGALTRVRNLANKLCKDDSILEYDRAVREYFDLGCAEMVCEPKVKYDGTYYMPHRPVYRPDKSTSKIRVVFDASAHGPGMPSLNEKLVTGENLLPDLAKMLLNFRMGRVGLIADIEKAFLQISLNEEDRDYHRFIWFRSPISEKITSVSDLPTFQIFRMCRVTFGITTSPFLLASTLRKHLIGQPDREFGKRMLESFYVDDFVIAVNSPQEAIDVYKRCTSMLSKASMNLRKWDSNHPELRRILFNDKSRSADTYQKVLGVIWYTVTDQLAIDINSITNNYSYFKEPTKRYILQTVARIFDPLGLLGPITITVKILLQTIWKLNIEWDEALPTDIKTQWVKWVNDVAELGNFSIPRCMLEDKNDQVELHIFADASPQAYGAVSYVKSLSNNTCNFVMAKGRVAPIKQALTLPKLELTAALCAARLQRYIIEKTDLNVATVFVWSDSKITLHWIEGKTTKWKPYVQNRVNEIRSMKNITWRYCPGKENPADFLTRGVSSARFLNESCLWLQGPSWLVNNSSWPNELNKDPIDETLISSFLVKANRGVAKEREPLFDLERYSKYEKVIRITAWILRFVNNINRKMNKNLNQLSTYELTKAELYWLKLVQEKEFPEETELLEKGKEINRTSSILKLSPFLDQDGVLRLGGRLQEASLSYEEKHPIILPKGSSLSHKLVWKAHEESMHCGTNSTLTKIRQKYWIIRARQLIKKIINKCVKCRKLRGKSGSEPFAPLPRDRITVTRPFNVTGIDFAGPLFIKTETGTKKVYIMLFTCAVIRAVHLELVENLTTESCVLGLRRFIGRRGVPDTIYSDNARTFKRADKELQVLTENLAKEELQDLARNKRIKWKFSVERAAWWGGFWERLVRSVKGCLKITLGRKFVMSEELQTILIEIEATINSRPLTYLDDDPTNLFILSASKFLIGSTDLGFSMDLNSKEIRRNEILKIWKNREAIIFKFWKIWQRDYLQQLKAFNQNNAAVSRSIKEGDIVILHDQERPRLMWKLVKVLQTFKGRDGRIRACEVVTGNRTKLRRPVQLLYPLEISGSEADFAPGEDVANKTE